MHIFEQFYIFVSKFQYSFYGSTIYHEYVTVVLPGNFFQRLNRNLIKQTKSSQSKKYHSVIIGRAQPQYSRNVKSFSKSGLPKNHFYEFIYFKTCPTLCTWLYIIIMSIEQWSICPSAYFSFLLVLRFHKISKVHSLYREKACEAPNKLLKIIRKWENIIPHL